MSDRSVRVVLTAAVDKFVSGMSQAKGSAEAFVKGLDGNKAALDGMMDRFAKVDAVAGVGLGLVTKSAIDWESAWAGVTKTVDGTTSELVELEGALREMARTMPASHKEIAAVAEAAGQLGVQTEAIDEFTRTMINLGETTNLTADEAATSLAQFMNVMGTTTGDVERLGSAIVHLGNNGASTERDIVAMAQRIAAAGKTAGMSETDVLAFASALSSVGVEAEAGGTAVSLTFTQIGKAVRESGAELDTIAKAAGMTSEQFRKAWGEDAARATESFVNGLGEMQRAGGDAYGVMESLGMSGIRQQDSLMRLAQAQGLLTESLQDSASAWDANSALAEEASKRYETTESKIKIAYNNITDAAIEFGAVTLPVVAQAAEAIAGLAKWFGDLPGPVKVVGTNLMGLAAGGGLAAAGLIKAATGAKSLYDDFRALIPEGSKLEGKLKGLAGAAGVAAGALALITAGQVVHELTNVRVSAGDAAVMLERFALSGGDLDEAFNGAEFGISTLDDALRTLGANDGWSQFRKGVQEVAGMGGDFVEAQESITALDEALASMDADTAAAAFQKIGDRAKELGLSTEQLAQMFPQYAARLQEASAAAGTNATSQEVMASAMDGAARAAQSAAEAIEEQTQKTREAASAALALSGSEIGLEAAIDSATEAVAKNGRTLDEATGKLDINTESGRANQQALDTIAQSALRLRESQEKAKASTETMNASTQRARDAFIQTARQMGLTEAAAGALADQYGLIPKTIHTSVTADTSAASRAIAKFIDDNNGRTIRVNVASSTPRFTYASGGPVYGPGTTTSDSIPAMLSNREFVHTAAAHDYYGSRLMWAINQMRIPREAFASMGFAGGGSPSSMSPPTYAPSAAPAGPIDLSAASVQAIAAVVIDGADRMSRRAVESDNRNRQAAGRPL